jgi:polyhydroxybutyrate depolymerase
MNSVAADYTWYTMHPVGTTAELDKGGSYGWNAEGCCPGCYDVEADDFAFANAMMDWAKENLCVDMSHIFTTGFSNGGFMAYSVACKLGNRLAGAAANAGSISKVTTANKATQAYFFVVTPLHRFPQQLQLDKCNSPSLGALPVVSFHSLADTYVPYDGNPVDASQVGCIPLFPLYICCWSSIGTGATAPLSSCTHGTVRDRTFVVVYPRLCT